MAPPKEDPLAVILERLESNNRREEEARQDLRRMVASVEQSVTSVENSLLSLAAGQARIESWKPQVETKIDELCNAVENLKFKTDVFINELPKKAAPLPTSEPSGVPVPAHLGTPATEATLGPLGRCDDDNHRMSGNGVVTTLLPAPVKGPNSPINFSPVPFNLLEPAT